MAGTICSFCNRFCCYPSSASDEEGHDHPASASPRSSPSVFDNTTEILPGTPKRSEAPIPGSSNVVTPMKDEKEDVNAHLNVSEFLQCDEPSSSGEYVDVSEHPSTSYSSGATIPGVIHTIIHIGQAYHGKEMELMDHISKLLELRNEEMLQPQKASNPSNFPCPEVPGFKKLNAILSWGRDIFSWGTDLKNLNEILSSASDFASKLKEVISGPVTTILKDIGQASVVTAGLLVVAYTLERFHDLSDNKDGCWDLIKEMSQLASIVKGLNESGKGTSSVIEEATKLVVEGAITCCTQLSHSGWKRFLLASKDKADLSGITQKLHFMYSKISVDIGTRNLSAIEILLASFERVLAAMNPPVSREYPDQAVGIDESIEKVVSHLEIESAQSAVMVILHGFEGMGKTTLADAVVSKNTVVSRLVGFKYSKVRMSKHSKIVNLQKEILEELMAPGDIISKIKTHEDGQRELRKRLEQVQAFIYIDNVSDGGALRELLPMDMTKAMKVRLLLTARNEAVKYACPRLCTVPKIYPMQEIQDEAALMILEREIKDGINMRQFKDIIDTCGGNPLLLTLAAPFIGRAPDKQEAYSKLVELLKDKLRSNFGSMHCASANEGLPDDCKAIFRHMLTC